MGSCAGSVVAKVATKTKIRVFSFHGGLITGKCLFVLCVLEICQTRACASFFLGSEPYKFNDLQCFVTS